MPKNSRSAPIVILSVCGFLKFDVIPKTPGAGSTVPGGRFASCWVFVGSKAAPQPGAGRPPVEPVAFAFTTYCVPRIPFDV